MPSRLAILLGGVPAGTAAVETTVDRHRAVLATFKVGADRPDSHAQRSCFDRCTNPRQLIGQNLRIARCVTLGYAGIHGSVTHWHGGIRTCYFLRDGRPFSCGLTSDWPHQQ